MFINKNLIGALVLGAIMALTPLAAMAQEPPDSGTVGQSGFQIQNLGTEQANVTIKYYDGPTDTEPVEQSQTVPANGSITLTSFTEGQFPDGVQPGFAGSVVIESDQPIAAIVNLLSADFQQGASYPGFNAGGTNVKLPLITRKNPGVGGNPVSTTINVQNASDSPVDVTITYSPNDATSGRAFTEPSFTLQPGTQRTFSQADNTDIGNESGEREGIFVGGAVVEASGPVAVTVESEGANQLLAYSGFPSDQVANSAVVPLIVSNNNGDFTGLQVQNAGTAAADITVTYGPNGATVEEGVELCDTPTARTIPGVAAGSSQTLLTFGISGNEFDPTNPGFDPQFATCRYVGSARITSEQPVVAIVNQVTNPSLKGSTYEGFNPASASGEIRAPLVFANNSGLISAVQVQNTGTSAADVTVAYSANTYTGSDPAPCETPGNVTRSIDGGASATFFQYGTDTLTDFPFNGDFAGCGYVGSATITSSANVVAIVNLENVISPLNDSRSTYNGFNQ